MKRYATFFLSILLLAALTACGSGSSPSGKDAPPVRTPMGTKDTEQTSDLEQAYSDLVERFRTLVSDPFGQDSDEPGEMGVLETARGMGDDAPYEMGYLIEDLSGDGIPELAVGGLRGMTNALYTLVDGKPELVFEGWYRSSYVYLGDGRFYYYGSNSAAESGQGVFALTKDGTRLECESFLFTGLNSDGDVVVYSNETGSWDIAESEKSDMTAEEFWALDPLGEPLPLIPFSGAEAGGTNLEDHISVRQIERDYGIGNALVSSWVKRYLQDGEDALEPHNGNPYAALHRSKSVSEVERLRLLAAKQEVEIARLKKGYWVEGVGANREYVTGSGKTTKFSKNSK